METYNILNLNNEITSSPENLIKKCEEKFNNQLDKLIYDIENNDYDEKVILISGPSCAGKTTFANLLEKKLINNGFNIVTTQMDNFFIDRAKRKRLKNGEEDFESLNIVNLKQMKKCFRELFKNKTAMFPVYDFKKCINMENQIKIDINDKSIIIFEGIHALNPKLYKSLDTKNIYKIFITNEDHYSYLDSSISAREMRLIRRIVRDREKRNFKPRETFDIWHNIVSAENEYILPFKSKADFIMDSSFAYELGLYTSPLKEMKEEDPELFASAPFLETATQILPIDKALVPENSLMWEFLQKIKADK